MTRISTFKQCDTVIVETKQLTEVTLGHNSPSLPSSAGKGWRTVFRATVLPKAATRQSKTHAAAKTESGLEHMRNEFVSLDRPDPLTERETEILRLMAGGFSNKEIANSLGVAEGTIKNHVSNILSKLGVRDRTRAVLKAFELQLV